MSLKRVEAPCPSCGANVEFKISSSLVTVCEYCQSVVARGDSKLEDHGKVARIVPTSSPLRLGMTGVYRDKSFEVVGRVQYSHAGGGIWNEWYASFPGDRWGWISEAQGKFHVLFKRRVAQASALPEKGSFDVGETLRIKGVEPLKVAEVGIATVNAAEGEMPFVLTPGQSHEYVDLHGAESSFASIEFSDQGATNLYLGKEASLEEIGLAPTHGVIDAEIVEIKAKSVSCPNCGGSLTLQAPDKTERVVCPFCSGVLDANQGNLQFLHTMTVKRFAQPVIQLGSTGKLRGQTYTVIGYMQRSVTYDRKYYWSEYLLYSADVGFRWLVHSDDHWSLVESVSIADVEEQAYSNACVYQRTKFRLFQRAAATVEYVLGEFYWKVAIGERVQMADYIAPPQSISVERTVLGHQADSVSQEITASVAEYLPHAELEKAFGLKPLRRGWGVAPNQPRAVKLLPIWLTWCGFAAALLLIYLVASLIAPKGRIDGEWFFVCLVGVTIVPGIASYVMLQHEKKRWEDSDYSPYSSE